MTDKDKIVKKLAGLAFDYISTSEYSDVGKLNRRLGYCEAILDILIDETEAPTPAE